MSKNQITRLIALIGLGIFIYLIRNVLFPIVISVLLYYVLNPLVLRLSGKWLGGLGLNRILAIVIAFLVMIAVIALALLFMIPPLAEELAVLVANIPSYLSQIQSLLDSLDKWQVSVNLPKEVDSMLLGAMQNVLGFISIVAQQSVNTTVGVLSRFIYLIIIPLITFFLLKDDATLAKGAVQNLPEAHRKIAARTLKKVDIVLRNYIVGQALLCVIVGTLTSLALAIFGIKFSLILGIVAAVAQLIPNIGPFIGAAPALIVALIMSPILAAEVGIFFLLINILIVAVLAPKILGDKLDLHPLTIVLSVLILGEIAGMWGLFLAAPIVAILKILYLELWDPA